MRILVFLMFWPVMAQAQPSAIAPDSVIGFLQLDANGDGRAERVLLTRNDSNDVDLFIVSDSPENPLAYFQAITSTNDDRLTLEPAENGAFDVVQTTRHGQGSTVFSQRIGWVSGPEAGYFTIGVGFHFSPRDENGEAVDCTVDFIKGWLETAINGGEMRGYTVQMPPTKLGAALPLGWSDLCGI